MAVGEIYRTIGQSGPGKRRNGFNHIAQLSFLLSQAANAQPMRPPKQESESSRAQRPEPGRLVVSRQNRKAQRGSVPIPNAIIIGRRYQEEIFARREIAVKRLSSHSSILPLAIVSL